MNKNSNFFLENMFLDSICSQKKNALFNCTDEELSKVSHYLKLNNSDIKIPYDSTATKLLEKWQIILNKNKNENNKIAIICEPNSFYQTSLFPEIFQVPFPTPTKTKFTFIDLFAGIGGFRIAMQNLGGECVFSSEWDNDARRTYMNNFGELPFGDITKESVKKCIPEKFDVLCAGFPCQAFSIAGYRKGFEDTRGTLFFDVATIIKKHRPKAFFLENVKNLKSHDNGRTFEIIESTLKKLGYIVYHKVMNTMEYCNIPQNRERIFIIGFDPLKVSRYKEFTFPNKIKLTKKISDCINPLEDDESLFYRENSKYYIFLKEAMTDENTIYQWRRQYVRKNQSNVCPTLTANMGTGGHNVPLVITPLGFRKLTPYECLQFQGFPNNFKFPNIAKSKCYKQVGNSVSVPLIQRVANQIITLL